MKTVRSVRAARISEETCASTECQSRLEALAEQYRPPLVRFFKRRISSEALAEDLAQEVFLRMAAKTDIMSIKNAEAFLFQTATNLLRDRYRRTKSRDAALREIAQRENLVEGISPERVLIGRELLDSVLTALTELPVRTKDIFLLHRLEGLKYSEIAALYDISVSAVEKHMIKTLAHLARHAE